MTLPRKPERSFPIPNQPFESPEVTTVRGPYWDMPLGNGLEADSYGSVQTEGSEPSEPTAYLYGANGFVGLGTGLQLGPNGYLEQSGGGYIYCTPAYPNLPPTSPPYGCETEVNTAGVTDFTDAWKECIFSEFPCVDSSAVTDFSYAWSGCYGLTSFPSINTSTGTNFTYSWAYSNLASFPKLNTSNGSIFYGSWYYCTNLSEFPNLDLSNGVDFYQTWQHCESLISFPPLNMSKGENFMFTWLGCTSLTSFSLVDVSSGTNFIQTWGNCESLTTFPPLDLSSGTNFSTAWNSCTSLTSFPAGMFDNCSATNFDDAWFNCALNQASVDNILVSLDTAGQSNGIVNIDGGTSAAPSAEGLAAKVSLEGKGWTVTTN